MFEPPLGSYFVVELDGAVNGGIKDFTRSRFSHAGIYLGAGLIGEAEPGGFRIVDLDEYDANKLAWNDEEPLTDAQRATIVAEARSLEGMPYGLLADLLIGLHVLRLPVLPFLRHRVDACKSIMCSQSVAVCYLKAGVTSILCGRKHPADVEPGDLAERITLRSWR